MKNCTHCKYAEWDLTAAGKLHPSGTGRCAVEIKIPPLPASMFWISAPYASYGHINRKKVFETDCTYFAQREKALDAPFKADQDSTANG